MDFEGSGNGAYGFSAAIEFTGEFFLIGQQFIWSTEGDAPGHCVLSTGVCSAKYQGSFELGNSTKNRHDHFAGRRCRSGRPGKMCQPAIYDRVLLQILRWKYS